MIRVGKKLVPYLPTLPRERKQKTPVFGDQGFFERGKSFYPPSADFSSQEISGYHATWALCGEKNLVDKLDGLCFLGQEWHKKKVSVSFLLKCI